MSSGRGQRLAEGLRLRRQGQDAAEGGPATTPKPTEAPALTGSQPIATPSVSAPSAGMYHFFSFKNWPWESAKISCILNF